MTDKFKTLKMPPLRNNISITFSAGENFLTFLHELIKLIEQLVAAERCGQITISVEEGDDNVARDSVPEPSDGQV